MDTAWDIRHKGLMPHYSRSIEEVFTHRWPSRRLQLLYVYVASFTSIYRQCMKANPFLADSRNAVLTVYGLVYLLRSVWCLDTIIISLFQIIASISLATVGPKTIICFMSDYVR